MGRHSRWVWTVALGATIAAAAPAEAQDAPRKGPAVGEMAPAFSGRGATRYGRVADPIELQDYRGKTIILAFFFRARTTG